MVKRAIDKQGLNEKTAEKNKSVPKEVSIHTKGIGGDPLVEPVPKYIEARNEKVIQGKNNSWIVLGRDRPASRLSGYGGHGDTQAGSIDIVVGRMSHEPRSDVNVDPDFVQDSARVHISQKTDIDNNFKLVRGKVGNSQAKSGIGLKADGVRIIGREGIKLVTGTDLENSQGGNVDTTLGIDIIANNDDSDLQPLVKGDNLAESLDKLIANIEDLSGIISTFLTSQMKYNEKIATHFHISPFFGMPTTPSETVMTAGLETMMNQLQDCIFGLQKHKAKIVGFKNTYIRPHGKKYINSRYNSVN